MASQPTIQVLIRNRERIIFNDSASAVSTYNNQGVFDILPEHSNFITLINKEILIHNLDKTTKQYKINTGVMKVNDNKVTIFLGILTQSPSVKSSPAPGNQS